jgi:DNA-binding FadR family transcriptional regulator
VTESARLASLLRPVRAGNAFEETVERLLTAIRLGVVAPGERFPAERDFAAQLGISRITLREAIRELAQAGYVESRRGRLGGTFVTGTPAVPSHGEARRIAREQADGLADALTFRMAVDTGAAEALALLVRQQGAGCAAPDGDGVPAAGPQSGPQSGPQPGPQQPAGQLTEVLTARLAELNAAVPRDYRRLDTLFHLAIAELTGSSLLAAAAADARIRLNDFLNAIPVLQRNIAHTAAQHTAIAEAIMTGDPDGARRAVAEHLEGTAALLRGFLA